MNDEIDEKDVIRYKDFLLGSLESMDDEELDVFDARFRLIDKRASLISIISGMSDDEDDIDEYGTPSSERLENMYVYVRDAYWAGE